MPSGQYLSFQKTCNSFTLNIARTRQFLSLYNNELSYGRETAQHMLEYSNLMTGGRTTSRCACWRFSKGAGQLECKFQTEGGITHHHCWCQKTRVIALSCGIKIYIRSALFGLVTKHACDRQTDGQNYDSQDCASIAASRGKN